MRKSVVDQAKGNESYIHIYMLGVVYIYIYIYIYDKTFVAIYMYIYWCLEAERNEHQQILRNQAE